MRRLYINDEEMLFEVVRPILLNGSSTSRTNSNLARASTGNSAGLPLGRECCRPLVVREFFQLQQPMFH